MLFNLLLNLAVQKKWYEHLFLHNSLICLTFNSLHKLSKNSHQQLDLYLMYATMNVM